MQLVINWPPSFELSWSQVGALTGILSVNLSLFVLVSFKCPKNAHFQNSFFRKFGSFKKGLSFISSNSYCLAPQKDAQETL